MPNNIIDKIRVSGTDYTLSATTSGVSVVEVTQAEYDALPSSAKTDTSKMYVITDAEAGDLTNYYTKTETNTLLGGKADTATTYTKQEVDNAITAATTTKQDRLVSGTNIKTINNTSILGSGNIDIQGGGGKAIEAGRGIDIASGETADTVSFNLPISADSNNNIFISTTSNVINGDSYVTNCFIGGGNNTLSLNGTSYGNFYNFVYGNYNTITKNKKVDAHNNTIFGENNTLSCSGQTCDSFICGNRNSGTTGNQYIFGSNNIANNVNEFAFGKTNKSERVTNLITFGDSGNTLFSIGNGIWGHYAYQQVRHNAFEVRQNGDIYIADVNDTSTSNYYEKPMIKLQDALGGGGGSYTPGDGIDITNNVISVTGMVETSAVTTAITSSSTDGQVPSAKCVYDQVGGLKLVKLTQSEYDALLVKDNDTLYIING